MGIWLLLLIPLIATFTITLFTRRYKDLSSYISIGAVVLCFILSLKPILYFLKHPHASPLEQAFPWLDIPGLYVEIGTLLDPLSVLMLFIVTFVGSLIHIYSRGYMHGDPGYSRFFACLSLFIFAMLGIVLANNFIQMFIFWELVGLASYLLIGYYFEKPSAADAAKKAFLVNRVGDFGFILGIFVIFYATGTFNFLAIERQIEAGNVNDWTLLLAALLIFCGVVGKSAQFPLHVWLPDAMEGPTPVSALIHAATMVAAGVYLLARTAFLYHAAPHEAAMVVAYIGGFTALLSSAIALAQSDIKRVIAYSTLASLGYMVMAMGVGGVSAGMLYLTTHAFFKALLFLAAGSVIHALHTNDIWEMGGLYSKMKVTGGTFIIGALAMIGVFPFSGFFAKDEILVATLASGNYILFGSGVITAFLIAIFISKLVFVTFFGERRYHGHPHESPPVMTVPLIILAFFAAVSGFVALPGMEPNFSTYIGGHIEGGEGGDFVAILSTLVVLAGIFVAWLIYQRGFVRAEAIANHSHLIHRALENRLYIDDFYDRVVVERIYNGTGRIFNFIEIHVIISFFVNGSAFITREIGKALRLLTTGRLQEYALLMVGGVVVLLFFFTFG